MSYMNKIEFYFYRCEMVLNNKSTSVDIMRWDFSVMGAKAYVLQLSENVRRSTEQNDEFEQLGFLQSIENDNTIALVATDNDKICGYILAEKKFSPYLEEPNVVHIANLGVKKEIRGQGIGKKLMDALLQKCEEDKIDEIRLGVFNKNISAYKFYEQYGFKPFEQRMNLRINKK